MWKENLAAEPLKSTGPAANARPIAEDEYQAIMDRLDATREIFRQNRELREVLARREAETRTLQSRNVELEEMLRKFAPMLLNVATTMGLAAKNEKPDVRSQL